MKYELETIPVWEAYKKGGECPLCSLQNAAEENSRAYFTGDSIMDPDTRVQVNARGFCSRHFDVLFNAGHKLGVALLTHTHLLDILAGYRKLTAKKPFVGDKNAKIFADLMLEYFEKREKQCIFCERVEQTLQRYAFTTAYLWKTDADFKTAVASSKGFCLIHLRTVLRMATDVLTGQNLTSFVDALSGIMDSRLGEMEKELLWFTQKFDYRNHDKPWGNSKDALVRTLQKLKGHFFLDRKE